MWTKRVALVGLALGAGIMGSACAAEEITDDALDAGLAATATATATEEEEALDAAEDELSLQDFARLPRCGGFAGILCRDNTTCVDLPGDDCDPARGGADCIGVCVRPDPRRLGCANPLRSYVSRDPNQCAVLRFRCAEGATAFFDRCGCGCLQRPGRPPTAGPTRCGDSVCGPGTFCCNESCGICAPLGGACIQIVCE